MRQRTITLWWILLVAALLLCCHVIPVLRGATLGPVSLRDRALALSASDTLVVVTSNTLYVWVAAYDASAIEGYLDFAPITYAASERRMTLGWDPPTNVVAGYVVYTSTNSSSFLKRVDVGNTLQFTIVLLPPITNFYAAYGQKSTNASSGFKDIGTIPVARWTNLDGSGLGPPKEFYRLRVQQQTNAIP